MPSSKSNKRNRKATDRQEQAKHNSQRSRKEANKLESEINKLRRLGIVPLGERPTMGMFGFKNRRVAEPKPVFLRKLTGRPISRPEIKLIFANEISPTQIATIASFLSDLYYYEYDERLTINNFSTLVEKEAMVTA